MSSLSRRESYRLFAKFVQAAVERKPRAFARARALEVERKHAIEWRIETIWECGLSAR
jgi:hypothetical protein